MERREEYVAAVLKEAEARQKEMADVRTVYLGGGTPSLLTCSQIESLAPAEGNLRGDRTALGSR